MPSRREAILEQAKPAQPAPEETLAQLEAARGALAEATHGGGVVPVKDCFGGLLYRGPVAPRAAAYDPFDPARVDDAPADARGGPYIPIACGQAPHVVKTYFFDEACLRPLPVRVMPDGRWSLGDSASKYGTADAANDAMVEQLLAEHEREHAGGGAARLAELVRKAEAADAELAEEPPETEDERRYRELIRARVSRGDITVDITKKPTEETDARSGPSSRRELHGRESFGRDRDTTESPSPDSITRPVVPAWSLSGKTLNCDEDRADSARHHAEPDTKDSSTAPPRELGRGVVREALARALGRRGRERDAQLAQPAIPSTSK